MTIFFPSGTALSSLEIYNPTSGTFALAAGSLSSPRELHAAAVLQNGEVIIVGGYCAGSTQTCPNGTVALASSDIYDPSTQTVSAGPAMSTPRQDLSATAQLDGKVLAAGGNNGKANGNQNLATAEVYDPTAGTFALTGSLATARQGHQGFLLPHSAAILIVGGTSGGAAVSAAELYYPLASGQDAPPNWNGTFNPTGSMASARTAATGASPSNGTPKSQNDGLLLVAHGKDASGNTLQSSELYGFAWVKTDARDYAPGTTVNITSGGFQPGETVTLHFQEVPYYDSHPDLTAIADSNGNISNSQFSPDQHDIDIRFYLYATGSASGFQAQTTFADGAAANLTITAYPAAADGGSFNLSYTNNGGNPKNQTSTTPQTNIGSSANSAFTITSIGPQNGCTWNGTISTTTTGGGSATPSGSGSTGNVTGTEANGNQTLTVTLNFSGCGTTTTIASSANPSTYGQSVTFTATVSSGGSPITSATGET